MGFFTSLFNPLKGEKSPRYVSEEAFRRNLAKQTTMAPLTVAELRKYGVHDLSTLKLEFFFYTDVEAKAQNLASAIRQLKYEVQVGRSASDASILLITGWSTPIAMDEKTVTVWTEQMCRLGFERDCEFDGWGTNPKQ